MVFLLADDEWRSDRTTSTAIGDLRQIAALLEGLRALGSGRVLDDVLALVMDSAIEVSRAERGFIMLESPSGELEFKIARQKGRVVLSGSTFATSLKIPQEVFQTGETRIVADLLDGDLANAHQRTVHHGIRHVLCVPLRLVRYVERASASSEEKRIGVLYLDSKEKGALLTDTTRSALDTLATEAAVAIENARLYREAVEKARLEQELALASQIQMAILPAGTSSPSATSSSRVAHHGSTGPQGEPLGNPMGVVLSMGVKKVYHAGDTGLFLDMQLIAEMNGPFDVALLRIGDNFTMGIDDAAKAAELRRARGVIPMHYDTFDVIKADPRKFAAKVEERGGRVQIVRPGQIYELG